MGAFSIWHWIIVLIVVILVFGTKKLRNMGSDVGGAVKSFKDAMHEEKDDLNVIENEQKDRSQQSTTEKTTEK